MKSQDNTIDKECYFCGEKPQTDKFYVVMRNKENVKHSVCTGCLEAMNCITKVLLKDVNGVFKTVVYINTDIEQERMEKEKRIEADKKKGTLDMFK